MKMPLSIMLGAVRLRCAQVLAMPRFDPGGGQSLAAPGRQGGWHGAGTHQVLGAVRLRCAQVLAMPRFDPGGGQSLAAPGHSWGLASSGADQGLDATRSCQGFALPDPG